MQKIFAVCAPGLEPFLARELTALGLLSAGIAKTHTDAEVEDDPASPVPEADSPRSADDPNADENPAAEGGIEFEGEIRDVYRANLHLRTATRVLLRLSTVQARTFEQLVEKVGRMPWKFYLRPGQPIAVRATCHRSRLYHTEAVAERIAEGIGERLGAPATLKRFQEDNETKEAPRLIVVRIVNDRCTVSIDTSGASLHRRGYRLATAKAPLRETLAAGMLFASGWDSQSPLLDPFCGSGTIPIEAALLALNIPPGLKRHFAFMGWPNFDRAIWKSVVDEAAKARRAPAQMPPILGSDRDAGAIQSARENALRAGVEDFVVFTEQSVSAIAPPPVPGWVVTNPPYGVRIVGKTDLRNLYAKFGAVLRQHCPQWRVTMLSSNPQLAQSTGLPFNKGISLRNGGLRIRLVGAKI